MAMQIACGMVHVHSKNVLHCDFSCCNMFIFEDWLLKLGDFGDSTIDGQEPHAGEKSRYQIPLRGGEWEEVDCTKREVFALGCGIYEVIAWKAPFPEMTEKQIEEKYANEEFPDTEGLLVEDVIRACWNKKFMTAAAMETALRERLMEFGQEHIGGTDCLNVRDDEACLVCNDKPKISEEYTGFKIALHMASRKASLTPRAIASPPRISATIDVCCSCKSRWPLV
jgi:Protein tyrosine and serine/threonine kinase